MGFVFAALANVFTWFRAALPWIGGFFGASISSWAISLGFGVVVFSGFTVLTNRLIATAVEAFNGLNAIGDMGADIIALMGYMWIDSALNLMISTGAFLLALKGVREGRYAAQAWYKPGQSRGGFDT